MLIQGATFIPDSRVILELIAGSGEQDNQLDGAKGQGEICNFLKNAIFSKSFLSYI